MRERKREREREREEREKGGKTVHILTWFDAEKLRKT